MKQKISIILGSKSDVEKLKTGFDLLDQYKVPYDLQIISAHRHPDKLREYCKGLEAQGIEIVIACAGLSAALPGCVASYVSIPVIGVPLNAGVFQGFESLLSIVEVPKGLGLVGTGVGKKGFINGILFAVKILALSSSEYKDILKSMESQFRQ
jgi:5-(carboxyamino)imidazole ribonucleotide mutase